MTWSKPSSYTWIKAELLLEDTHDTTETSSTKFDEDIPYSIMVWSGIRPVLKRDSVKSIDAQLEKCQLKEESL